MNGSLHERRFSNTVSIPLLHSSEKVGERDVDERLRSPRPSSPFARAFDTAWSSRPRVTSNFHNSKAPVASYTSYLFSSSLRFLFSLVGHALYGLIPSFVEARLRREPPKPERQHPTAYLDGIRGLAAFAVFLCHLSYQTWFITYGFGAGEPGENAWPIQLPIVKLFYSGPPAVALFFVISGYALSYKPLRQMRARQYDGLMVTMSSAVFRRSFRLFLPCFASTFVVAMMAQMGFYSATAEFAFNRTFIGRAHWEDHAWTAPTMYEQIVDWAYKMFDFVHPWDWFIFGGSVDLDRHLWTIPTEFRASMVLFLTQMMVARMRTTLRLLTIMVLIYWVIHWDRWEMILFWSGLLLAELDHIALARKQAANADPPDIQLGAKQATASRSRRDTLWRYFWIANFACGLFLASYPDDLGHDTPGYRYLTTLIPEYYTEKYRFWQSVAAVQIIWAVNNADVLKRLFMGAFPQYLGKISFALYLVHGPMIHTFGYWVMPRAWALTGSETRFHFELGFFLASCAIVPVTVWAADVFWRAIDVPCVRFARWLEAKVIVQG